MKVAPDGKRFFHVEDRFVRIAPSFEQCPAELRFREAMTRQDPFWMRKQLD